MLAALACVDVVVPLSEPTAHELIREVRPDVYVKGGDYQRDELVEIDLLDELKIPVHLATLVPGVSTTDLGTACAIRRNQFEFAKACSTSSTVRGIILVRFSCPSAVTKMSSSMRQPKPSDSR